MKLEAGEKQPLTARVYEKIRDDILEGRYATGDYLVETKLAAELGVSRTPIREALKQLELEELVEAIPNRGVVVQGISAHDISDMMRGQRDRAIQLQTAVEIAKAADKKPLSIAFSEIARQEVGVDSDSIDIKHH